MLAMATTWLLGLGGTTAIDTLESASFSASNDKTKVGLILQRAAIVPGVMYIPFAVLWFYSAGFLRLLKREEELADSVQEFLRVLIPGGIFYVAFEAQKKFLQAQNIMHAGSYMLLITSPLNLALNYVLISPVGMGLLGAPLATGRLGGVDLAAQSVICTSDQLLNTIPFG